MLNRFIFLFHKNFTYPILGIVISFSCEADSEKNRCEEMKENGIVNEYQYPVLPGTKEWNELESHTEMIRVCQIPLADLDNMCTHSLIATFLSYPLIGDVFFYETIQLGFQYLSETFNGLKELRERDDVMEELLSGYITYDFDIIYQNYQNNDTAQAFQSITDFFFLGFLLSQNDILQKSDHVIEKEIVQIALEKHEQIKLCKLSICSNCAISNINLITKILLKANYAPFLELTKTYPFIQDIFNNKRKDYSQLTNTEMELILNIAKSFVD